MKFDYRKYLFIRFMIIISKISFTSFIPCFILFYMILIERLYNFLIYNPTVYRVQHNKSFMKFLRGIQLPVQKIIPKLCYFFVFCFCIFFKNLITYLCLQGRNTYIYQPQTRLGKQYIIKCQTANIRWPF